MSQKTDEIKNDLVKGNLHDIENFSKPKDVREIVFRNYSVNAASIADVVNTCIQIDAELKKMSVQDQKREKFTIALIEAINNAQEHGYGFNKYEEVVVNLLKLTDGYLLVSVQNKGCPIQLEKIKYLLKKDSILKPGITRGRGYILMKKSVDVLFISHYEFYTEVFLGIFNES